MLADTGYREFSKSIVLATSQNANPCTGGIDLDPVQRAKAKVPLHLIVDCRDSYFLKYWNIFGGPPCNIIQ